MFGILAKFFRFSARDIQLCFRQKVDIMQVLL